MDKAFWHSKWDTNDIRFHIGSVHPMLEKHFKSIAPGRVFVPFCGKSADLTWLKDRGWEVIGSELSPKACESYFSENKITFQKQTQGEFTVYQSDKTEIWCGDHFKLPKKVFENISAWYDRAALVALPPEMRTNYISFFNENFSAFSSKIFQMLLIGLEYDSPSVEGPPFCVRQKEIKDGFGKNLKIELVEEYVDPLFKQDPNF